MANTNSLSSKNEFVSRLHTPENETDWYKMLGPTDLEKHLSDFDDINWKVEYWKQEETEFNFPNLEVIDFSKSIYLSISVCPDTFETFQFWIGLGGHKEYMKNGTLEVERKVRIYGTGSEKVNKPKRIIHCFFKRDYSRLAKELSGSYIIFEELEDLYQNFD